MAKEALLKYLEESLKHVLCVNLDPASRESVNAAIAMFIIEDASRYSEKGACHPFQYNGKRLCPFYRLHRIQYLNGQGLSHHPLTFLQSYFNFIAQNFFYFANRDLSSVKYSSSKRGLRFRLGEHLNKVLRAARST